MAEVLVCEPGVQPKETQPEVVDEDRRSFINSFGKAALVAPPVITTLLATSMSSPAIAQSHGNGGGTNGLFLIGAGAVPVVAAATDRETEQLAEPAEAPPPEVQPELEYPPAPLVPPPPPPPPIIGERG